MRFHRIEGTGNPPSVGPRSGTGSRWWIENVKPFGVFQRKFWTHQLRELSKAVEAQQDRSGEEFVEHRRVQQPAHKCSAIPETPLKRFLKACHLRLKVQRSVHRIDRIEWYESVRGHDLQVTRACCHKSSLSIESPLFRLGPRETYHLG